MSWAATGAQTFSRTYSYDTLNRIGGMSSPGELCTGFSWTIDIWANRTDQSGTGGSCGNSHMTVNTLNRIADQNYSYDLAGNLTGVPGAISYQYDGEGRMTSLNGGCPNTLCYTYDANGRRVRKVASGTTTDYFYDLGGNVAAERAGSTWTKGYVYFDGQMLAQYDNTLNPTTTLFAHKDHLGSTRLLTKMNQGTQECTDYLPYGEQQTSVCTSSGSATTTHKFTGKERDSESGLDNFGARYDSSSIGRFMSADPAGTASFRLTNPQTFNLYTYAVNNPIRFIDPSGMFIFDTSNNCGSENRRCLHKAEKKQEGQQNKVRKWLGKLDTAIANLQKSGRDPARLARLQASRDAIGQERVRNGVVIGSLEQVNSHITNQGWNNHGQVSPTASMATLRPDQADHANYYIAVNFNSAGNDSVRGVDIAHEGTHVDDYGLGYGPGGQSWLRTMETRGYETSAWTAGALGMRSLEKRGIEIYHRGWTSNQIETHIDALLDALHIQ